MNGKVHLVGAGPGDPELLTLKAIRRLAQADAIVCDRLVSHEIRCYGNPDAQWHDVGKRVGRGGQFQQEQINQLLLDLARSGQNVVRLKGGDPFVFGRGGEELFFLAKHGICVEVVPGITAATGCAAALGLPLTHRGVATSVRFVTGHLRGDAALTLDWQALADPDCTLVFYMGMANAPIISSALIAHGLTASTPVMLVHSGTTNQQHSIATTLLELPQVAAQLKPPALMIVGQVAALAHNKDVFNASDAPLPRSMEELKKWTSLAA